MILIVPGIRGWFEEVIWILMLSDDLPDGFYLVVNGFSFIIFCSVLASASNGGSDLWWKNLCMVLPVCCSIAPLILILAEGCGGVTNVWEELEKLSLFFIRFGFKGLAWWKLYFNCFFFQTKYFLHCLFALFVSSYFKNNWKLCLPALGLEELIHGLFIYCKVDVK